MKITASQNLKEVEANIAMLSSESRLERSKTINFVNHIRKLERDLVNNYNPNDSDSKLNLLNFDPSLLNVKLQEEFYNYDLMRAVSCIISSIVTPNNIKIYSDNYKIKKYINKLRQIGEVSNNGIALLGGYKDENFVIVKSQQEKSDTNEDLINEVCIGLFGTNQLRKLIPNFAFIYGTMKCELPLINDDKSAILRCSNGSDNTFFAIYENIFPSISFTEKLLSPSLTPREFSELFMQVVFAIKVANDECDFTHYGLHSNNLLVRETNINSFYIQYPIEEEIEGSRKKQNYYIKSSNGNIATIIDYGNSHIKYPFNKETREGQSLGYARDMRQYGMYNDKSFPINDVLLLLTTSLRIMNKKTFNHAKKFVEFFTDESIIYGDHNGFLFTINNTYFILPENIAKLFDYNEFIVHCVNVVDQIGSNDPIILMEHPTEGRVLKCGEYHCSSFNTLINEIIPQNTITPTTFEEFIEIYDINLDTFGPNSGKIISIKNDFEKNLNSANNIAYEKFIELNDIYNDKRDRWISFIDNDLKLVFDGINILDLEIMMKFYDISKKFIMSYKNLSYQSEIIQYTLSIFSLVNNKVIMDQRINSKNYDKLNNTLSSFSPLLNNPNLTDRMDLMLFYNREFNILRNEF